MRGTTTSASGGRAGDGGGGTVAFVLQFHLHLRLNLLPINIDLKQNTTKVAPPVAGKTTDVRLTPSLYCKNRLLVSSLSKFCKYRWRKASTVSTCVLCFTANSRALKKVDTKYENNLSDDLMKGAQTGILYGVFLERY